MEFNHTNERNMIFSTQEYRNTIRHLREVGLVQDNKIRKEINSKLSSMGPDVINMGLIAAVALYESKPHSNQNADDAGKQKVLICRAILRLMPDNNQCHLLSTYLQQNHHADTAKTIFHFNKALACLKATSQLFEEI